MKTQRISRMVLAATVCWLGGAQISLADSSNASSNVGGNMPSQGSVPHDKRTDLTGGQQGIPDEYSTTPVRQGSLKEVTDSKWLNKEVTNNQGEKLGKITKVLKDEKTQKEEYVFMEIAGTRDARPLPFARFQQSGDKITLNAKKDDLLPSVNRNETKDMSPDLAFYMDEIEQKRSENKPKVGPGDGRGTNRPDASSGPMGEDKTAGNLGPRAEPPGQAPQFEGEGQKHNK
jgi:hypothetical protein